MRFFDRTKPLFFSSESISNVFYSRVCLTQAESAITPYSYPFPNLTPHASDNLGPLLFRSILHRFSSISPYSSISSLFRSNRFNRYALPFFRLWSLPPYNVLVFTTSVFVFSFTTLNTRIYKRRCRFECRKRKYIFVSRQSTNEIILCRSTIR